MNSKNSQLIKDYILHYKIIVAVLFYFLFSILLFTFSGINIIIPCIWKTLFNLDCPGCGLTTAFIRLLHFDFYGAYESNRLIFIILPFSLWYVWKDWIGFKSINNKN
ncbi:MAG: hypothetical protein ACI94Y_001448 [Maribacter sp.]|jgi:hypothetical protein